MTQTHLPVKNYLSIYLVVNAVQSLYNTMFGVHMNGPFKSEPRYKVISLQRNTWKMMICNENAFVKFHSNKMIVLYPNPFYNEVCYT